MKKKVSLALLALGAWNTGCSDEKKISPSSVFHDMAVPRIIKPGYPSYSDVSSRTLTIRDVPYEDEKNIFRAAPAFHVTRIDWAYIWFTQREIQAVQDIKQRGYSFCGSAAQHVPCWIGDMAPADWQGEIIMTDIQGNPSIMPFIRTWKNPQLIGDISNPIYYDGHFEYYKKLIDAGCDNLQRDAANHHLMAVTTLGGGFTKTGVAGFSRWLAANVGSETLQNLGVTDVSTFDYKVYLTAKGAPTGDAFSLNSYNDPLKKYWYEYWENQSIEFFRRLVRDIKVYAGRDIPISVNNTSFQIWDKLELLFDFGMSELMMVSANPNHLLDRLRATENHGKFQVIGSAKLLGIEVPHEEKSTLNNKVIATVYANGGLAQVPWDTFEQTPDGGGRFFGKPADYAPVFGFIRGIAPYLEKYDRAYDYSTKGILSPKVNPENKPLQIEGTDNEVCAFVRVNIGKPASPVVIHLIDWGKSLLVSSQKGANEVWELASGETVYKYVKGMENLKRGPAKPFEAVFRQDAFRVPAESLTFKLLTPRPYDRTQHETAEQTKKYTDLVAEQRLTARTENGEIRLTLPPLQPWGVLVVTVNEQ